MRFSVTFASELEDDMGAGVTETDIVRLVGRVAPLLTHEFLRTGASVSELRRAVAMAGAPRGPAGKLSPRMRRLVDLIGAVGQGVGAETAA